MTEPIRVCLVDDHALFRKGLVGLLEEHDDFEVVGEASNGPEGVEACLAASPHVVLMDVHMPGGGGVDAVRSLKQRSQSHVIMLTISDSDSDLFAAIDAGADGYLLKNSDPEELYQSIRKVAAGDGVLAPEVTPSVMRVISRSRPSQEGPELSSRERQVLELLAAGGTTAQVATELSIAQSTVKTHVRHILKKLDSRNRAEAVGKAAALGMLDDSAS